MLNFIVCEDEKIFQQALQQQIENFMMGSDIDYKIHLFSSYDKKFEEIVMKEIGFKIYFLDIKTKYGSGIDAARFIREECDDWTSIIVIITAFSEYRYEALTNRLYLFDFINKMDNCDKKVQEDLKRIMKSYTNIERSLNYEYNYMVNKIEYRHILYIEKESDSKLCIVHTTYDDYKVPKTISELEKILDNDFFRSHRSAIVNLKKIKTYDSRSNTITFDDGTTTDLVSRNKKKELIERVTNDD